MTSGSIAFMAQHHAESKIDAHSLVRVFGIDTSGKAFTQNTRARNFCGNGALLTGLDYVLKTGDVIGVQFGPKKARFRVALVVPAGEGGKEEFEIQMQEGQECPWKDALTPCGETAPSASRRRQRRHKVDVKLELRDEFTHAPMRVSATDVSGYGCYVERIASLPVGTKMTAEFWMEKEKWNTLAVVRTCDPGLGMGIEFMSLTSEQRDRFQSYLENLDHANCFRFL